MRIPYLMRVETKRVNQGLEVICEPVGKASNKVAPLRRRPARAIEHEDRNSASS